MAIDRERQIQRQRETDRCGDRQRRTDTATERNRQMRRQTEKDRYSDRERFATAVYFLSA